MLGAFCFWYGWPNGERREGVHENPSSGLNIAGSNPARATNYRLSLNGLGFFITSLDQLLTK